MNSDSITADADGGINVSQYTFRPCTVDLTFHNIGYSVKVKNGEKTILQNLNGSFEHGKLHCIMGASGAGKTSLLNVLAGFNKITNGTVTINGESLPANNCSKMMASISSYIIQQDYLLADLTVRETLRFAAKLKLQTETLDANSLHRILEDLLRKMALTDVGDRFIARLSGGQKKRVSVAVELINYPPLFFLDEPTSGLDSTSCYRLIELLKTIASAGCNVISTIHQPNSRVFRMFDTLRVLAPGGRLAYSGAPLALTSSLRRVGVDCAAYENPADLLFEKDNIHRLAKKWNTSLQQHSDEDSASLTIGKDEFDYNRLKFRLTSFEGDDVDVRLHISQQRKETVKRRKFSRLLPQFYGEELMQYCKSQESSSWYQFRILLHRWFIQARRDKVFFIGRFCGFFFVTMVFGSTFQLVGKEASKIVFNTSFMYVLTVVPVVGTAVVTILNFPVTFNVLLRENINSWYSVGAFFLSRAIVDDLMVLLLSTVVTTIMWLMSSQIQWPGIAVPLLALTMGLHGLTSHHFAYIVAMGADEESLPFLPFTVGMLHTLFAGFLVPINNLPVWIRWVQYFYYGQFAHRATLRIAFSKLLPDDNPHGGQVKFPCGHGASEDYNPLCAIKTGDQALEYVRVFPEDSSLMIDIIVVGGYLVFFFSMGWFLLTLRLRAAKNAIARA